MTRATTWSIGTLILAGILAASCAGNGSSPLFPGTKPAGPAPQLGGIATDGELTESAAAIFEIAVDTANETATANLKASRNAQQTDDLYELGISNFINERSLVVDKVRRTGSTVELDYTFTHPFAAPTDLDATPTRTNRADLAVCGRVLFLLDVDSPAGNTFFEGAASGQVVANTNLVLNNDGYYVPAGLLDLPGYQANAFPYKVLVDETMDPRTSQADGLPRSNGGSPYGNYNPTAGWQRDTMGSTRDAWTGHGVIHHGQSAHNTLTLDRSVMEDGEIFTFDAAILVKYEDPRGGNTSTEKRGNRLPPSEANLAKFVYRHPHGSLDVESIEFVGEDGTFLSNAISASTLRFRVVDWDAYANVTTLPDLHDDLSAASNVAPGETGAPSLAVCIPGVLGDASTIVSLDPGALQADDQHFGGDATPDSGVPGDALYYSALVTKSAGSGQVDGVYTGLVRATDIEDSLTQPYMTFLTESLQPVTGELPRPIAYQHFQVVLGGGGTGNGNISPSLSLSTPANVTSGNATSITVVGYSDPDGDTITVNIDWDNNGTYEDTKLLVGGSGAGQVFTSPIEYTNTSLLAQTRYIPVRFTDGEIPAPLNYAPLLTFNIGPNQAPLIGLGTPAAVQNGTGTSVQFLSGGDPEGDPITLAIDWDNNPLTASETRIIQAPYAPVSFNSPITYTSSTPNETRQIPVTVSDTLHPPVTYAPVLTFTLVDVIGSLPSLSLATPANVLSGNGTTITVQSANDPDNNLITLAIDWDNNPLTPPQQQTIAPPYATPITYVSPATYKNATLTAEPRTIPVTVSDGVNAAAAYSPALSFTLGPNRAPVVSGVPAISNSPAASPAFFNMGIGNATAVDPEGDTPIVFHVTNNQNASTWNANGFPISGLGSFVYPPTSSVNFTVYACDPLHPTTSGTVYPTVQGILSCTASTLILNATFDSNLSGFVFGPNYTPSLFNSDNSDKSSWSRCAVMAYMGPQFSGNCLTTGPDGGACGVANDSYDQNVRNNVVSPQFSLSGRSNARLVFDSVFNGRVGVNQARYRVYATSNGSTWVQIYENFVSSIPDVENDVEVDLGAYVGQPAVRLRFEFYDNSVSSSFSVPGGRYAGWSIDNVQVFACP